MSAMFRSYTIGADDGSYVYKCSPPTQLKLTKELKYARTWRNENDLISMVSHMNETRSEHGKWHIITLETTEIGWDWDEEE